MWSRATIRKASMAIAVVVCLGWWPATATASDSTDVLVLLTEVVEGGISADDQQIRFWWSNADEPRWTGSDDIVLAALEEAGVEPTRPESVDISRIYRRPGLSTNNAAQVGSLLGAERVLVGEIQYRPIGPVAPLGYRGIEARANLTLVPAGDSDGVALDQFTVTRQVFDGDVDDLLARAREVTGTALGDVMGQSLHRTSGRVGSRGGDQLLALRDVGRAEHLEKVRQRLMELDEVRTVVERWATEGLIALEVKSAGDSDVLDYAMRVLEHHEFDDFEVLRSEESTVDDVTEFWLRSRDRE